MFCKLFFFTLQCIITYEFCYWQTIGLINLIDGGAKINPVCYHSQSVTNLVSVLFSPRTIRWDIYFKEAMLFKNPRKSSRRYRSILNKGVLFKILTFSSCELSLKIFVAPLFSYNVLLLFHFKRFVRFLRRSFSKSWCCHFIPLQTE